MPNNLTQIIKKSAVNMAAQYGMRMPTTTPHLIKTKTNLGSIGVVLLHQETIQQLRTLSGPLTSICEYQTHFWALIARIRQTDNSTIDIAIPTVFFNYKQEVNSAHIDFELQDVCNMSEALEPVHNVMVNKFMSSKFIAELQQIFAGHAIEYLSTDMNTIHKHP